MVDQQALGGQIAVPSLLAAVLDDEELVAVDVTLQEQGFVGLLILLVPDGQGVIGAGVGDDIVNPSHEVLLVGRIAHGRVGVVGIAAGVHDVPVAHAVVAAIVRVIEVGQTQAVAELVAEGANAVDGPAVVAAAMHLVEHGKSVHIGPAAVGTEGAIAAHAIVVGRREGPVTGPDGIGNGVRGLCLAHTGIDDDHHVAVVVIVGIKGAERHTVGSGHLAGLGHHRAQTLVIAARIAAVILAVLGQCVDAKDLKVGVIFAVRLVLEVLLHACVARQHGFDDLFTGVAELLVLVLHQDDGHLARSLGRHARLGIAAAHTKPWRGAMTGLKAVLGHRQVAALGLDKGRLAGGAVLDLVGAYGGQSRQRRGVVVVAIVTQCDHQAVACEQSMIKGVTHGLHPQGGAVTLIQRVPAGFSGHCHCGYCTAQQQHQRNTDSSHLKLEF